ncbi:MAG: aldose 1-epimerase family protein [Kiritimatiellales bacterium]|nr:aldose 1-epimerase family protein [Kiritimatiellales bacterium]MCF7864695.1 aldose 1-epimerase family protein [Kiritimatiellales bacterium]
MNMNEKELKSYVGSMDQLARIRTSVLDDGRGRGIRMADIDNGSGLRFTVLLDRGMDIGDASFNGIPFAYQSPVGAVHPSYFESDGLRWLRSFGGGLVVGCGLRNVGVPEAEKGMRVDGPLGLHGRLSNTPAEDIAVSKVWKTGKYVLSISGIIREVSVFGENLELRRTISTAMGDNSISICDEVANRGIRPSPLMILYHINAGFPLLSESSVVEGKVTSTVPRNERAAAGLSEWNVCQPPTDGYAEQCFFHDVEADADGMARMTLRNPESGLAMEVAYRKAELPYFTQWKMMGRQGYVVGLEPANCHPDGQSAEKENGTLKIIEPDETVEFKTVITLSKG